MCCAALAACDTNPRAPPDGGAPIALRGIVSLEIGRLEGADEYVFGRVGGVAMDTAGRVFVADAQSDEIRVYARDGTFLFRAARRGSGPGEVHGPCCLAFGPDGRLWVRDTGNARYQSYRLTPDGAVFELSVRMRHSAARLGAPTTFDTAGHLIDVGQRTPAPPSPDPTPETVRFTLDSAGGVLHERVLPDPAPDGIDWAVIERERMGSVTRLFVYQPHGSLPLFAHGPRGAWAGAVSGRYAVHWVSSAGERLVVRDLVGPALSDDERQRAQEQLEASAAWAGRSVAQLPFGVPDRKAPLRALWFDQRGRLWIHLAPAGGEPNHADVYDLDGTRTAVAEWPADIDLRSGFVAEDAALGVHRDSLRVERVVRLTWVRG